MMIDNISDDERKLAELFDRLAVVVQENDQRAIETFLQSNQPYESQLRSLLPTIQAMIGIGDESLPAPETNSLDPALEVAQRELGDFQLVREIGRGGMGIVYEAYHRSMGRKVALKILPFAAVIDPRQVQRFQNEVRAAAALQHQNIVPVYSVGCEKGVHYYAMQFVEGATLTEIITGLRNEKPQPPASQPSADRAAHRLHREKPTPAVGESDSFKPELVPPKQFTETELLSELSTARSTHRSSWYRSVTEFMIQAAEALAHAHGRGVIHRDIKPGNLMVDSTGNLWITDFGLARLEVDAGITMTGDVIGTLRYLSPEQSTGSNALIDERSDVYSLGATMYELLALRPAFDGTDRHHLLRQIADDEPKPLHRYDSLVPRELEIIVQKAMEKSPHDRYASAKELADDLARFVEHRPILAKPPTVAVRLRKWSLRHIGVVWTSLVTLLVMVVVLSVTALFVSSSRNDARKAEAVARKRLDRALDAEQRAAQHADEAEAARRESNALLYAADLRLTADGLKNGTLGRSVERLMRHLPEKGSVDRRGFVWHYLWDQLHPEIATWSTGESNFCVRYSPDSRLLAIGMESGMVTLRDSHSGHELKRLRLHSDIIRDLAFSSDGELLATAGDDGQIGIWNVPRQELIASVSASGDSVDAVAWSADSATLFYASDLFVYGWSLPLKQPLGRLGPHPASIYDIDVSADGIRLAVASRSLVHNMTGQVTLWQLSDLNSKSMWPSASPLKELPSKHKCTSVTFSHDGSLIAAGTSTGELIIWSSGNTNQRLLDTELHTSNIFDISYSSDDRFVATASKDGTISVLETETWTTIASFQGHAGRVYGVDFSPEEAIFATAGADASIKIWPARFVRFPLVQISPLRTHRIEVNEMSNRVAIASARHLHDGAEFMASSDHVFEVFPSVTCAWFGSHHVATSLRLSLPLDHNSFDAPPVQLGDVDADGDVDRFAGFASNHRIVWQENLAGEWLPPRLSQRRDFISVETRLGPQRKPVRIESVYGAGEVAIFENGINYPALPVATTVRKIPYPTVIDIDDLNGDGRMDLICASRIPGSIQFCPQSGSSTSESFFDEWRVCATLPDASVVKAITVGSHGLKGIAAGSFQSKELVVLKNLGENSGDLQFDELQRLPTDPIRPLAIDEIDVNHDGKPDLVVGGTEGLRYFQRREDGYAPECIEITTLEGATWARQLPANVQIVDTNSRTIVQEFHTGDEGIDLIAGTTNGTRLATVSWSGVLRFWDKPGEQLSAFDTGDTQVLDVVFDRHGRLALATGDDVLVFDWGNRIHPRTLRHHSDTVVQVRFSNDNRLLLSTSRDRTAMIWDLDKGSPWKKLSGHTSPVTAGAFSPDDRLAVTGDESGVVKVWDVYTGQQLLELDDFPYAVRTLRFDSLNQLKVWGNSFNKPSTAVFEGTWHVGQSKRQPEKVESDLQ